VRVVTVKWLLLDDQRGSRTSGSGGLSKVTAASAEAEGAAAVSTTMAP